MKREYQKSTLVPSSAVKSVSNETSLSDNQFRLQELSRAHSTLIDSTSKLDYFEDISPTHDLAETLAPFEAYILVNTVQATQGWNQLTPDEQKRVALLLGSCSTQLSAHMRIYFKERLPSYLQLSALEQRNILVELGTRSAVTPDPREKDGLAKSLPRRVNETVSSSLSSYLLESVEQVNIGFEAKKYNYVFGSEQQQIPIYEPVKRSPDLLYHTRDQALEALARLPLSNRKLIREVILHEQRNSADATWAKEFNDPDFRAYMTAGADGIVNVFPRIRYRSQNEMNGTMIHETAHIWARRTWGEDETKGKWLEWKNAMEADVISVSYYATNAIGEDVAETVQAYVSTQNNQNAHKDYLALFPHRFAILKRELG